MTIDKSTPMVFDAASAANAEYTTARVRRSQPAAGVVS
jgi:hypothetical protein